MTQVPDQPPTEGPSRADERVPSRVVVHTGDGKGKTSAAMGIVMRAAARGWRVSVVQFVKDGRWKTGEETSARRLGVEWWSIGDGFTWDSSDLERTEAIATRGMGRRECADPGRRARAGRAGRDHVPDELGMDRR